MLQPTHGTLHAMREAKGQQEEARRQSSVRRLGLDVRAQSSPQAADSTVCLPRAAAKHNRATPAAAVAGRAERRLQARSCYSALAPAPSAPCSPREFRLHKHAPAAGAGRLAAARKHSYQAHLYTMELAAEAIRGHRSAHSLATGPVMAEPFISPLGLTMTPALSSK